MALMRICRALCVAALMLLATSATAANPWPTPQTEGEWALAIIDVETTGLDPGHAEMIDIGAVYTDLGGNVLGRFFTRMMPPHPGRIHPGAAAVNGFSAERWQALGAPAEAEAAARFLEFHEQAAAGRRVIFTAYNAPFDRGFVDAWLRRNGSSFDALFAYMPLDLPSAAWGRGFRAMGGAQLAGMLGIAPETNDPLQHTGETGAEWNLMVYRALLGRPVPPGK